MNQPWFSFKTAAWSFLAWNAAEGYHGGHYAAGLFWLALAVAATVWFSTMENDE